jgi:hypothetical protein
MKQFFEIFALIFISMLLGFVGIGVVILCLIFLYAFFPIMHIFHMLAFVIIIAGGIICVQTSYKGFKRLKEDFL